MSPFEAGGVDLAELCRDLAAAGLDANVEVDLSARTTYAVGGRAACAVVADTSESVRTVASVLANRQEVECLVVGKGSNLLVSDEGFEGLAVILASSTTEHDVVVDGEFLAVAGAVPMPVLSRRSAALDRGGLEWAVGVPGSVGGAVRMNAGGHGSDMSETVVDAEVVSLRSGRTSWVSGSDLGFHFRGSALASYHVVVGARLRTTWRSREQCMNEIDAVVAWRREHQPGGRNAGSVFVNPGDGAVAAGALIDECGLRGLSVGGAMVSTKHANFIQATDGARARDIVELMCLVQDRVEREHGIRLRSEIRLVGFDDEVRERFGDPRHTTPDHLARAARLGELLGDAGDGR